MIFAGITKSSLLDYPGNISIVLYTPGCNFDCFYCHNRSLIDDLSENVTMDEVMDLLNKRIGLIDSVVISGGEPTLHSDLIQFLKKIKSMGYLTKLDTNGSNPEVIKKCIEENAVDYYAVDYKAPISRYKEIARSSAISADVLETINMLIDNNKTFEVRTTVVPQLSLYDLIQMAQELPQLPRYVLNTYRQPRNFLETDEHLIKTPPYPESVIAEFALTIKLYQPNVILPF